MLAQMTFCVSFMQAAKALCLSLRHSVLTQMSICVPFMRAAKTGKSDRVLTQLAICVTFMRAAKTGKSALFYSSLVATRVWFRTCGDIRVVMDFVLLECFITCFKMTLVAMCHWSCFMESTLVNIQVILLRESFGTGSTQRWLDTIMRGSRNFRQWGPGSTDRKIIMCLDVSFQV